MPTFETSLTYTRNKYRISHSTNMAIMKIVLCTFSVLVAATINAATIERQFPDMVRLGTIGNKTFYTTANTTFQVNWMAARDICNQGGYEFVIFHSDAEFDFVRNQVDYSTQLWIDASMKDMETMAGRGAFVYGDGSEITTKNVMVNPAQWVCLYFSGDDHIFSDLCLSGLRGILCQSRSNNGTNLK